jgi:hypothetical protein
MEKVKTISKKLKVNSIRHRSGQALLITVMLLAVALTVVLALSYTSKTDVQLSKLEEENQRALAAAEAGIDALVNQTTGQSVVISDLDGSLVQFSGSAEKAITQGPQFSTPLLQANGHFTFYLDDYPDFDNPYSGSLVLYYSTKASCTDSSADALEITMIYGTSYPYTIKRFIADGGNRLVAGTDKYQSQGNYTIGDVAYTCKTKSIAISLPNPNMMIVRSIFNATRVGFETSGGSGSLPPQGTIITSEAETPSGVKKIIQLFQSYPQIPLEFFTTSF